MHMQHVNRKNETCKEQNIVNSTTKPKATHLLKTYTEQFQVKHKTGQKQPQTMLRSRPQYLEQQVL